MSDYISLEVFTIQHFDAYLFYFSRLPTRHAVSSLLRVHYWLRYQTTHCITLSFLHNSQTIPEMTILNSGLLSPDDYLSPTQVSRTTTYYHTTLGIPTTTYHHNTTSGTRAPRTVLLRTFLATIQPWIATHTTGQTSLHSDISPQFSDTHHVKEQDNYPEELDITTLH